VVLVFILIGLILAGLGIWRGVVYFRMSHRERWQRRYDAKLKKNHPFFI
jgi:hypothetical protein